MKKTALYISGLLCIAMLLPGCKNSRKALVPSEPVAVKVISAGDSYSGGERTYVATIKSSHKALISSPFPAKVTKIEVKQGKYVAKGTVLATLYSESVLSAVKIADATLAQAQDGYDRLQKVKDNGSVSEIKMVEVETALAKAQASSAAAHKALEDCQVKAVTGGIVAEVFCEEGADVTLSQPLFKITDTGALEAEVAIPETDLSLIRSGQAGTLVIPALANVSIPVWVGVKGVSADPLSRTYNCSLILGRIYQDMLPGMVGKVKFSTAPKANSSIVIPADKVRMDTEGKYVWTVDSLDIVRKRYIVPGGFSGKGIIVESGLIAGDRVIVEGVSKVSTGMKVRVVE